jgi:Homing endonuclease associated repeat
MATRKRAYRSGPRITCRVCGARLLRLPMHLQQKHGMTGAAYRVRYSEAPLISPALADDSGDRFRQVCPRCGGTGCDRGCQKPCDHECPQCDGTGLFEWRQEDVLKAIRSYARSHHGKPPTLRRWQQPKPGEPQSSTVQQLFGSWNTAIAAAGFTPRNRGTVPGTRRPRPEPRYCRKGLHRMTGRNLYVRPNGSRLCRACAREAQARRWRERREYYLRDR